MSHFSKKRAPTPPRFAGDDSRHCLDHPVRRRAAIDAMFREDAVLYDPKGGIFRGRDEMDWIAGVTKATHPDFEYQPLFRPAELGGAGRVRWASRTLGKPPAHAGLDFIVARNVCACSHKQRSSL